MANANSPRKGMSGWAWFFLVLIVWATAAIIVETRKGAAQFASGTAPPAGGARILVPGDRGRLESADGLDINVAVDQAVLKELADAQANGDDFVIERPAAYPN